MKTFIYFILYALLLANIILLFTFGLDMELARREYNQKIENSWRRPIEYCIFEYTCQHYNKLLKENIL